MKNISTLASLWNNFVKFCLKKQEMVQHDIDCQQMMILRDPNYNFYKYYQQTSSVSQHGTIFVQTDYPIMLNNDILL